MKDLSHPDPTNVFNLFGLIPWDPPHILLIGGWPLIMGVTMFLQQKLNPQPPDPIQAKVFMALPFVFTYMLASFPAGLVGRILSKTRTLDLNSVAAVQSFSATIC